MVDDPAPAPCPDGAATDRPRDLRAELAARPVTEHVAVLEDEHARLQRQLATVDQL